MFEYILLYYNNFLIGNSVSSEINYYPLSDNSSYCDNVINFSPKLQENLDLIDKFKSFENNWNGYDALRFSKSVIDNARSALYFLDRQPDVFPTGRNSIQFEYEKDNGDYLEFEIFEDSIVAFQIISDEENEYLVNEMEMRKMVVEFYA